MGEQKGLHAHDSYRIPLNFKTYRFCGGGKSNLSVIIDWKFPWPSSSVQFSSVQFSSVSQLCPTLCDPMDCSTPGIPVHHQLLELIQTHIHYVDDAIQPSHPLLSPFPLAINHSQHQGLFKWVSSSHEVAKVLGFQLQHHSFQWTPRTDLLQDGLFGSPCSLRDSQESSPTPQFKDINFWHSTVFIVQI